MNAIMNELQRLKYHRGFPHESFLRCPVFLQDKFEYLSVLQKHGFCNPTLKVERSEWFIETGSPSHAILTTIEHFLDNCKEEGMGWVVKLPFVTNQIVKGIKTKEEVYKKLAKIFNDDFRGIYPYAMIQPCMKNRKEYKVVYIPSKNITYISSTSRTASCGNGKRAFSFGDHSELFAFVKKVVEFFQAECPYVICDGLFRVDVFMNQANELVVNEFESLEAVYYSSRSTLENTVTDFLKSYWLDKLFTLDIIKQITDHNSNMESMNKVEERKKENTKKTKRAKFV